MIQQLSCFALAVLVLSSNVEANNKPCKYVLQTLCQGPCAANTTDDVLARYNCIADCYTANSKLLGKCPIPNVPNLHRYNCSDVFKVRCDNCTSKTGTAFLNCAGTCAKNKLNNFNQCQFKQGDFPGRQNLTSNCTTAITSSCKNCFTRDKSMEQTLVCLGTCALETAVQEGCKQNATESGGNQGSGNNNSTSNCTDVLSQCPRCKSLVGWDELNCYADCQAVQNFRSNCKFPTKFLGGFPANSTCGTEILQDCQNCVQSSTSLRGAIKCFGDCVQGISACKPRTKNYCLNQVCTQCANMSTSAICYVRCAETKAAQILTCMNGGN